MLDTGDNIKKTIRELEELLDISDIPEDELKGYDFSYLDDSND